MHAQTVESFTWLALAVPILVSGALLALVMVLLAIPDTRKVGWIVLTASMGLGMVLFVLAGSWTYTSKSVLVPPQPVVIKDYPDPSRGQGRWQGQPDDSYHEFQRVVVSPINQQGDGRSAEMADSKLNSSATANLPAETPPASSDEKQPIDKKLTAESARLIDALSRVLAKTILEDRTAWEDLADKATKQMAQPVEQDAPKAEAAVANTTKPTNKPPPLFNQETPKAESAAANTAAAIAEIVPTPNSKPSWVDKPLHREGSDYFVDAVGDPYATPVECEAALPECVKKKAVMPFLEVFMPEAAGKVSIPADMLQHAVVEQWVETRNTSQGEMHILHARVKIDQGMQDYLKESYRQTLVSRRLLPLGLYFSLGLVALAAVWGYLKTDLATGGKHRGILRTAAAIVILSVVAALVAVTA